MRRATSPFSTVPGRSSSGTFVFGRCSLILARHRERTAEDIQSLRSRDAIAAVDDEERDAAHAEHACFVEVARDGVDVTIALEGLAHFGAVEAHLARKTHK